MYHLCYLVGTTMNFNVTHSGLHCRDGKSCGTFSTRVAPRPHPLPRPPSVPAPSELQQVRRPQPELVSTRSLVEHVPVVLLVVQLDPRPVPRPTRLSPGRRESLVTPIPGRTALESTPGAETTLLGHGRGLHGRHVATRLTVLAVKLR